MPEISIILDQLGGNKYFSTLDLASGFHQIKMHSKDIEKTAFSINFGKCEFVWMPFGLKNAPSIFQRALNYVLREHIGKRCYVYVDDVVIFGKKPRRTQRKFANRFAHITKSKPKNTKRQVKILTHLD